MKLFKSLTDIGVTSALEPEDISRIRLTNKLSFVTATLMILIGPILAFERSLFIPLLLDFGLKISVLFFNYAGKYTVAKTVLYYTQAVAIGYFGYVLAPLLQLEYVVVLLIAVNFYIFKTDLPRKIGLTVALIDLALIEYAHYRHPF